MLIADSEWSEGSAVVRTTVVLGSSARAHLVSRRGLVFDSRFMVGAAAARDVATIYLVLDGWIEPSTRDRVEGPCGWALAEDEFERPRRGAATFRSGGEPLTALEVCLPAREVLAPIGLAREPLVLPEDVWRLLRELARPGAPVERTFRAVLAALARAGVITAAPLAELDTDDPPQLVRLWEVLAALYRGQETSAIVKAVAAASQLSIRQTERAVAELDDRFGLHGGFRATVRTLRLRRAVLLLSAKSSSVGGVARSVGYGSGEAMGRAFRDAGLPSPAEIRDALATG